MSGGAAAAAAAPFFHGDADALLMLPDIEADFIKLPFEGTTRFTSGKGPTYKTGGHARMTAATQGGSFFGSATGPDLKFDTGGSGNKNAEFVELACGALLESQLQYGRLPGYNYPRTLVIGPRAAFEGSGATVSLRERTWGIKPAIQSDNWANVHAYDRIVVVNHYFRAARSIVKTGNTVMLIIANLDHSAENDNGKIPARVAAAQYSDGTAPELAPSATATQMMGTVLKALGLSDKLTVGNYRDRAVLNFGKLSDYSSAAMFALERIMRQALPFEDAPDVLFHINDTDPRHQLMKRAVRSGFIPPRTIPSNPVAWPVPTTQDELVDLMNKRLGYGADNTITFGAIANGAAVMDADSLDALARSILDGDTAPASSYDAFTPLEDDWY